MLPLPLRVAALALPTLLLLGVAELGFRAFPSRVDTVRRLVTSSGDERFYTLKPGVRLRFEGAFSRLSEPVVWRINEQGIRSDRRVPSRSERYRVATFGDSETFGWSVAQADTFQRRMEARDGRVEVINLGVPGYNADNVAGHMERRLAELEVDQVLYLVNKNDFDEPLSTRRVIADSPLLRRLRFLYQVTFMKPARVRARRTPERARVFAAAVQRMVSTCQQHHLPLVLGFLHWWSRFALEQYAPGLDRGPAGPGSVRFVNVERWINDDPKEDEHLTRVSHAKMADLFCEVLAGEAGQGCVPAGWAPRMARGPRARRAGQAS